MSNATKNEFKCTWGILTMYMEGREWSVSFSGNVPREVRKEVERMEKMRPRPDSGMVNFAIRQIVKGSLLYIK